jgi:hypothetical protein
VRLGRVAVDLGQVPVDAHEPELLVEQTEPDRRHLVERLELAELGAGAGLARA